MADWLAGTLITIAMVPLAFGISHGKAIIKSAWAKRRKATTDYASLSAWPTCGTILPCQSWLGKAIEETTLPLHVREAEHIAARAWYTWPAKLAEGGDDD